jgi:hypothetical protein
MARTKAGCQALLIIKHSYGYVPYVVHLNSSQIPHVQGQRLVVSCTAAGRKDVRKTMVSVLLNPLPASTAAGHKKQ